MIQERKKHRWNHSADKMSGTCKDCGTTYRKHALDRPVRRNGRYGLFMQSFNTVWVRPSGKPFKGANTPLCKPVSKPIKSRWVRIRENADAPD